MLFQNRADRDIEEEIQREFEEERELEHLAGLRLFYRRLGEAYLELLAEGRIISERYLERFWRIDARRRRNHDLPLLSGHPLEGMIWVLKNTYPRVMLTLERQEDVEVEMELRGGVAGIEGEDKEWREENIRRLEKEVLWMDNERHKYTREHRRNERLRVRALRIGWVVLPTRALEVLERVIRKMQGVLPRNAGRYA